jgi:EF-P beta-lysylation protein EpmB
MLNLPHPPLWRQVLRTNFTHWQKLADFLQLSPAQSAQILQKAHFPLNLPVRLASKIQKGTLNDPILKQFLPTLEEHVATEHYSIDPIQDRVFCRTTKLLQKYEGRALLLCTSACAMHCRYCFRQNYPYESSNHQFENELQEIAADTSLREIILSGGDPLSLSNETLSLLLNRLNSIPHVQRIRFHTRFPIGIPERIDSSFISLLENSQKQIWFVFHSNHPSEFDEDIWAALAQIRRLGIPLLNQTVLLRDVNDSVETLKKLFEKLVDHGISPYYLHQLDRVQGAAHFEVPEEKGRQLIETVRKQLSGYAVPLYVREIAGESNKTPL